MTDYAKYYSAFFSLNNEEKIIFNKMLIEEHSNIKHGLFLMLLFKELRHDIPSMFRVVNIGVMEGSISKSVIINLKNFAKEVIVLSNYYKHLDDGIINMVKLSKLERFSIVGISRLFILRTLQKYKIEYKTSKDIK